MRKIVKSVNYPYKPQTVQQLTILDHERRLEFCVWGLGQLQDDPNFFRNVLFTDESGFTKRGIINRQNFRQWSPENPGWTIQIPRQEQWRVNVWAGILNDRIIGPWFFDGNMDSEVYADLLENVLPVLLEDVPLDLRLRMWWQQDGHPAHTARTSLRILRERFPNRIIGIRGSVS